MCCTVKSSTSFFIHGYFGHRVNNKYDNSITMASHAIAWKQKLYHSTNFISYPENVQMIAANNADQVSLIITPSL